MCASQFVISASYITRLKTTSPDTLQSYIEAGIITENNGVYSTSNSQFIHFKDPNATVPATILEVSSEPIELDTCIDENDKTCVFIDCSYEEAGGEIEVLKGQFVLMLQLKINVS